MRSYFELKMGIKDGRESLSVQQGSHDLIFALFSGRGKRTAKQESK
jgi:hypothetical protein